jgi:YfiR/HmsC-like
MADSGRHRAAMSGRMSRRQVLARLSCAFLCMLAAAPSLTAQKPSQYDAEAAYLYNFGKFVRWPADLFSAQKSFDICILGQDPFSGALDRLIVGDQIDGKTIRDRAIATTPDATGCAIVYIAGSEETNLRRDIAALKGRGQLLVSDLPHFLEEGGMIQFVLEEERVRFEVNLDPVTGSRLVLSSELLKVAVKVLGTPAPGGSP